MKLLLKLTACVLVVLYLFLSCNKDKDEGDTPPSPNRSPVANAGADLFLTITTCGGTATAFLDGKGSTDPDNNIVSYVWTKITGPDLYVMDPVNQTQVKVYNMAPGEFAFQLEVKDAGGLSSKDTVAISVKSTKAFSQLDLDVTFTDTYDFQNNVEDCYYLPCSYYDLILIEGQTNITPIGNLTIYLSDYSDTADIRYADSSYLSIYNNDKGIYGNASVNFKKLIQQGGGAFSGKWVVRGGYPEGCEPTIFTSLPPLTITGNLNTATKQVTVSIKGKVFL